MQQTSGIGSTSKGASNAAASQASDAIRQMGSLAERGAEQANAALSTAKDRGSEIAADAAEVVARYRSTIEASVRSQPIMALGIAAFAGLIIGGFLRSR